MITPRDPDSLIGIAESRPYVLHTRVVTGTGGGPEKTILNSPRYLAKYGIGCSCVFMRPPGDPGFATIEDKAKIDSIRSHYDLRTAMIGMVCSSRQ